LYALLPHSNFSTIISKMTWSDTSRLAEVF
jgi:hypothetical protein